MGSRGNPETSLRKKSPSEKVQWESFWLRKLDMKEGHKGQKTKKELWIMVDDTLFYIKWTKEVEWSDTKSITLFLT